MLKQDVQFANVDIELESRENLQGLINHFGDNVILQHHGRLENGNDFASLSLVLVEISFGIDHTPERIIAAFCVLVDGLSSDAREIWDKCEEKRFDIGFESVNGKETLSTKIEQETIKRVSDVGGSIVITIYPVPE